jgi:branched-chain amino acid transport system substrate-binding protein
MKSRFLVLALILVMVLSACGPTAEEPVVDVPAVEEPVVEEPVVEEPVVEEPVVEEPVVEEPAGEDPMEICESDDFGCAVIAPGQTIKIGMGSPMTGGNAAFGIDAEQSGLIAVDDAGLFNGFQFELIAEDDGGTPEGGAAVANKFAADPTVVGVAGHLFSGATFAGLPIYEEIGIPLLSPSATNPDLTRQGSRVMNRVPFTDEAQGNAAATYMYNELGFRKVAFLHDGQDYGKGLAEIAAATFESLGGEVVELMGITPGEADYSPVLSTIAAKDPDALYFGGYTQEGVVLVNNMPTSGMEDVVFFGCDGTFGADFLDRTGANGEGTYHATPRTPPETPEKDAFDATYEERWGQAPGVLSPFSWNSYDCTTALIKMVMEVAVLGNDGSLYIPRGALVDGVRNLTNYVGISGTYTCFPDGDCNVEGPTFWIVQDGEFVAVN